MREPPHHLSPRTHSASYQRGLSLLSLPMPCCGWRPVSECTPLLLSRPACSNMPHRSVVTAAPDAAGFANRCERIPPAVSRPANRAAVSVWPRPTFESHVVGSCAAPRPLPRRRRARWWERTVQGACTVARARGKTDPVGAELACAIPRETPGSATRRAASRRNRRSAPLSCHVSCRLPRV